MGLIKDLKYGKDYFPFLDASHLKLGKKPITKSAACVSAQMSSHTTFTLLFSSKGHHCCLTSYVLSMPPVVNESFTW